MTFAPCTVFEYPFLMQDFSAFLQAFPPMVISWVGLGGFLFIWAGSKSQSLIIRKVVMPFGVLCLIFSFVWMLQYFQIYTGVTGTVESGLGVLR